MTDGIRGGTWDQGLGTTVGPFPKGAHSPSEPLGRAPTSGSGGARVVHPWVPECEVGSKMRCASRLALASKSPSRSPASHVGATASGRRFRDSPVLDETESGRSLREYRRRRDRGSPVRHPTNHPPGGRSPGRSSQGVPSLLFRGRRLTGRSVECRRHDDSGAPSSS
jgi:hypothetical protein